MSVRADERSECARYAKRRCEDEEGRKENESITVLDDEEQAIATEKGYSP